MYVGFDGLGGELAGKNRKGRNEWLRFIHTIYLFLLLSFQCSSAHYIYIYIYLYVLT